MIGIVVVGPMAEDDVGSGDPEGLDEFQPRLAGIRQELIVEIEPDEFGADQVGSAAGLPSAT